MGAWLAGVSWPDALVGVVGSGVVGGAVWLARLPFRRRRERADALAEWIPAARQLELAIFARDATSASVHRAWIGYPIDRWRAILGPDMGFRQFDAAKGALQTVEMLYERGRLTEAALEEHRLARSAFANRIRGLSSEANAANVRREQRASLRRDCLKRPLATWRRERHNARMRRAREGSKAL
ncbi:hypothetical protein [Agrococcus beijingensis]|uniref:hypothetical protein n=1 Tax=Agrococcus beijingensis TaxID=3068634 RepID=UPI002742854E|nr:hypothetical protein [Agrococcus sp. REN33]